MACLSAARSHNAGDPSPVSDSLIPGQQEESLGTPLQSRVAQPFHFYTLTSSVREEGSGQLPIPFFNEPTGTWWLINMLIILIANGVTYQQQIV